jgi:hypothetical protein
MFELLKCKEECDLRDWDGFKTDFKALACELQDTLTPEGLREALRSKLPWKFREWIMHKEQEEDRKKPTAEIVFPVHISDVASLKATLKAIVGQAPKEATSLGGNRWRLVYDKKRDMESLLGMDGLKLEGREKEPPIKVQQAETVLTVEEMMDLVEDKLQLKAKKALYLGREPRRQIHQVEKEPEKKISFSEPLSSSPKPPTTPGGSPTSSSTTSPRSPYPQTAATSARTPPGQIPPPSGQPRQESNRWAQGKPGGKPWTWGAQWQNSGPGPWVGTVGAKLETGKSDEEKRKEILEGFPNQVCKYHDGCRFDGCKRWHPGQPEP